MMVIILTTTTTTTTTVFGLCSAGNHINRKLFSIAFMSTEVFMVIICKIHKLRQPIIFTILITFRLILVMTVI